MYYAKFQKNDCCIDHAPIVLEFDSADGAIQFVSEQLDLEQNVNHYSAESIADLLADDPEEYAFLGDGPGYYDLDRNFLCSGVRMNDNLRFGDWSIYGAFSDGDGGQ